MYGHPAVAKLLLDNGARVDIETDEGKSALELAIEHGNKAVADVILSSDHWREALKACSVGKDNNLDTPLRMLIRKFPELASKVLDKCISKEQNKDSKFIFNFDFTFLEDTFNYKRIVDDQTKKFAAEDGPVGEKSIRRFEFKPGNAPYNSDNNVTSENHPLMLMTKQKQKSLLKHPLSLALLRDKWNRYKYLFYFYLVYYCVFLALTTAYVHIDMDQVGKEENNAKLLLTFRVPIVVVISVGVFLEVLDLLRVKISNINHITYVCSTKIIFKDGIELFQR